MIRGLLNLRCQAGHRFFSPQPKLWAGKECGHSWGQGRGQRCYYPLKRISPPSRRR